MTAVRSGLSVLMPNYNNGRYLAQALESLVSQDLPAEEILVVDDASTDDSREIIERFARRHASIRTTWLAHNRGPQEVIVRLLAEARGTYLFPIGSDDYVLPGWFRKSMALLRKHPQAGLCTGFYRPIDSEGNCLAHRRRGVVRRTPGFIGPAEARQRMRDHGCWIFGNAAMYRRDLLDRSGGFRPELGPYADGFIQEVLAMRHGACYIPEVMTCWRVTDRSYSVRFGRDPENQRQLAHAVLRLMKSEYADVFDSTLVSIFALRSRCETRICENEAALARDFLPVRVLRRAHNLTLAFLRKISYLLHSPPWRWTHAAFYLLQSQLLHRRISQGASSTTQVHGEY